MSFGLYMQQRAGQVVPVPEQCVDAFYGEVNPGGLMLGGSTLAEKATHCVPLHMSIWHRYIAT